jgi:hypothetical protein
MPNRRLDGRSIAALHERCVAGVFKIDDPKIGHEVPDRKNLERALKRLQRPLETKLLQAQQTCAVQLAQRVEADVRAAELAYQQHDYISAGEKLGEADLAWGGLASERLIELARLLAPGFSESSGDMAGGRPAAEAKGNSG